MITHNHNHRADASHASKDGKRGKRDQAKSEQFLTRTRVKRVKGKRDEATPAELLTTSPTNDQEPVTNDSSASSPSLPPSPAPLPRGRRKSLKAEDKRLIGMLLKEGFSQRRCAELVGCVHGTIINEVKRDAPFAELVRLSRIEAERSPLAQIRSAAQKSWRAAAWLIERADRERKEDQALEAEFNAALHESAMLSEQQEAEIARQQEESQRKQELLKKIEQLTAQAITEEEERTQQEKAESRKSNDEGPTTKDQESFLTTPPDASAPSQGRPSFPGVNIKDMLAVNGLQPPCDFRFGE